MALPASGANSRLIMKQESAYGVNPGGTDWLLMPFYGPTDFGAEQALQDNPLIGLADSRDDGDPIHDAVTSTASIEVPMDKVELGRWLQLLFGDPTTTGSSDYTHVFKSGGAGLPSAALELGHTDVDQYFLMLGAQANTLEVNAQPTGRPTVKIGLMGKTVTRDTTSVDAAPTAPSGFEQFLAFHATLKRNSSTIGRITSAQFTYSNGLEMNRSVGGGEDPEDASEGASTLSGSLGVRLAADAEPLLEDAEGKVPLALELAFVRSSTKKIVWTLPRIFLPRKRSQIQGKGGVQYTFDMRGAYDSATGAALKVEVFNQLSSY